VKSTRSFTMMPKPDEHNIVQKGRPIKVFRGVVLGTKCGVGISGELEYCTADGRANGIISALKSPVSWTCETAKTSSPQLQEQA